MNDLKVLPCKRCGDVPELDNGWIDGSPGQDSLACKCGVLAYASYGELLPWWNEVMETKKSGILWYGKPIEDLNEKDFIEYVNHTPGISSRFL